MSLLRNLETKIEGLVEGTFGRVFRSEVRPIELARKLVREMDENSVPSVSRVYAPHEYDIWLSPEDRERYEGIEAEVIDELGAYLLEHARRERLVLSARPSIGIHTDDSLELGEFGIETHPPRLDGEQEPAQHAQALEPSERSERGDWLSEPEAAAEPAAGNTMIYSGSRRLREPLEQSARRRELGALLIVEGEEVVVPPAGAVIGRSRECDVVLHDGGVSRRHAEIRPAAGGWTVADLGSTNGCKLRGRLIAGAEQLRPGDRIELGSTVIVFELR
ncbi:MAG: FhaA domain-containing protein [Solirubrobacteraceae bacterium]